jgi:hypothetical protein
MTQGTTESGQTQAVRVAGGGVLMPSQPSLTQHNLIIRMTLLQMRSRG